MGQMTPIEFESLHMNESRHTHGCVMVRIEMTRILQDLMEWASVTRVPIILAWALAMSDSVSVRYSVVHFVAVCCCMLLLQNVAVCYTENTSMSFRQVWLCCSMLQYVAVWYSMLQCGVVCCRVLQRVAACCNMSKCVSVCCSVLQRIAACCSVLSRVRKGMEQLPP